MGGILKTRASGCNYNLEHSADKCKNNFNSIEVYLFFNLFNSLKNIFTEESTIKNQKVKSTLFPNSLRFVRSHPRTCSNFGTTWNTGGPTSIYLIHLNFRYRVCIEQGVPWYSGNFRMRTHSETRTWHDKNIQWNAPHRWVLTTQLNHLASLAKWLSVCLRTKWLWVRFRLQSLKFIYSWLKHFWYKGRKIYLHIFM